MEWWMIIQAAVTRSDFKKSTQILQKTICKTLKFFPDTMQARIYKLERFVNQIKIDRTVSNHLSM